MMITNIKCREEGEKIKLTWEWPPEIELVYISAGAEENTLLFTLQEYKKRGGCVLQRREGETTYYVQPFRHENGKDILMEKSEISVCFKTKITYAHTEKIGLPIFGARYTNHEITLFAQHDIPANTICYTKKENAFPTRPQDGVMYLFGEVIKAATPVTRIVSSEKNEYIRLFVCEEFVKFYDLRED